MKHSISIIFLLIVCIRTIHGCFPCYPELQVSEMQKSVIQKLNQLEYSMEETKKTLISLEQYSTSLNQYISSWHSYDSNHNNLNSNPQITKIPVGTHGPAFSVDIPLVPNSLPQYVYLPTDSIVFTEPNVGYVEPNIGYNQQNARTFNLEYNTHSNLEKVKQKVTLIEGKVTDAISNITALQYDENNVKNSQTSIKIQIKNIINDNLVELRKRLVTLDDYYKQLDTKYSQIVSSFDDVINNKMGDIDNKMAVLKNQKQSIDSLNAQFMGLNNEVIAAKNRISEFNHEIEHLKTEIHKSECPKFKETELQNELNTMKTEYNHMKIEMHKILTLNQQLKKLVSDMSEVRNEMKSAKIELKDLKQNTSNSVERTKLNELKNQIGKCKSEVELLKSRESDWEKKMNQRIGSVDKQLKETNEKYKNMLQTCSQNKTIGRVESVERASANLNRNIEEMRNQVNHLNNVYERTFGSGTAMATMEMAEAITNNVENLKDDLGRLIVTLKKRLNIEQL